MKDEMFKELVTSVREGGKILRGEAEPTRTFPVEAPDVKKIRRDFNLTQDEFAALLVLQRNVPRKPRKNGCAWGRTPPRTPIFSVIFGSECPSVIQPCAVILGISVKTLRNWEQGRRTPEGAARVLLQVAAKHPEAISDVVK